MAKYLCIFKFSLAAKCELNPFDKGIIKKCLEKNYTITRNHTWRSAFSFSKKPKQEKGNLEPSIDIQSSKNIISL